MKEEIINKQRYNLSRAYMNWRKVRLSICHKNWSGKTSLRRWCLEEVREQAIQIFWKKNHSRQKNRNWKDLNQEHVQCVQIVAENPMRIQQRGTGKVVEGEVQEVRGNRCKGSKSPRTLSEGRDFITLHQMRSHWRILSQATT